MDTFDIILFLIVITVIIALIIINVNSVIENKLSNISVNIPPIHIPNPQVTVKVQKSCGSDDFYVYVEKENTNNQQLQTVSVNQLNEHFNDTTIPTTTPVTSVTPVTSETQVTSVIMEEQKTTNENIEKCNNKSLDKQRLDAYKYLIQNKIETSKFPICSNMNNNNIINKNISSEHIINDEEIDLLEYYRKHQYFVKSYLEDPVVRGYNMNQYDKSATLSEIGKLPLTNDFKNPKPYGYIFEK